MDPADIILNISRAIQVYDLRSHDHIGSFLIDRKRNTVGPQRREHFYKPFLMRQFFPIDHKAHQQLTAGKAFADQYMAHQPRMRFFIIRRDPVLIHKA